MCLGAVLCVGEALGVKSDELDAPEFPSRTPAPPSVRAIELAGFDIGVGLGLLAGGVSGAVMPRMNRPRKKPPTPSPILCVNLISIPYLTRPCVNPDLPDHTKKT